MFGLNLDNTSLSHFHPLEVVGCGGESHLQVSEN